MANTCNARTKGTGGTCRLYATKPGGRCWLHGGRSTGPKTPEGKARSALNGVLGGRPRKSANGATTCPRTYVKFAHKLNY